MSRTVRHINYYNRRPSKWELSMHRLAQLGIKDESWLITRDPRNGFMLGYDGKPRSHLYPRHDKQRGWKQDYCGRKTRKFVKRSASKYRRKQPIEMNDD